MAQTGVASPGFAPSGFAPAGAPAPAIGAAGTPQALVPSEAGAAGGAVSGGLAPAAGLVGGAGSALVPGGLSNASTGGGGGANRLTAAHGRTGGLGWAQDLPPSLQTVVQALNTPAFRRWVPVLLVLAVIAVFTLSFLWMQAAPYRAVMPGMTEADQQAAFEALKSAQFKPVIDPVSGQLKVPGDRYHEARMALAAQGLPRSGSLGIDGLKDSTSMTTSQFMEQVRYNAAVEQELARSILQIGSIQAARVHLAAPKPSVFVRERAAPKASVVVSPHPGRAVSAAQVQAIVHLVASSVPYLTPEGVTVVDNLGKMLTEGNQAGKLGQTTAQTQHQQQLEATYRDRIQGILSPIVGESNVRSQVNLTLDFTQVESTTEDFDGRNQGPRTRSEQLSEEKAGQARPEGVPGALSNRAPDPPVAASGASAGSGAGGEMATQSSKTARNYELDRTVRHVRNALGKVERVSVSVLINAREGGEGQLGYTPQELEHMQQLVRGVVGFEAGRGDVLALVPAKFGPGAVVDPGPVWWQDEAIHSLVKSALVALAFLAVLALVVRPWMQARSRGATAAPMDAAAQQRDGELSEEDLKMIQIGEGETLEEIKAKLKPKRSVISAEMLDTANTYDDKVALIRMLVAEDSGRVASVLKNMIKAG